MAAYLFSGIVAAAEVRYWATMPLTSAGYRPRTPEQGVLYTVVRTHLEAFLQEVAERTNGSGLPRFVVDEFREFLTCGVLAEGFARFQCDGCGLNHLLPFSCKGRGFCPRCGGRRMAERAAHLVDHVLPDVPVRQWVLSLPYRLRYLLAWDHDLCRAVVGVYARALLGFLRRRARWDGVIDGRGGMVAVIQRFGGALNLNVQTRYLALSPSRSHGKSSRCVSDVSPTTSRPVCFKRAMTVRTRSRSRSVRWISHGANGTTCRIGRTPPSTSFLMVVSLVLVYLAAACSDSTLGSTSELVRPWMP